MLSKALTEEEDRKMYELTVMATIFFRVFSVRFALFSGQSLRHPLHLSERIQSQQLLPGVETPFNDPVHRFGIITVTIIASCPLLLA